MNLPLRTMITIFVVLPSVLCWCYWPLERGTNIYMCKNTGRANCTRISSWGSCVNLIGGKFVSGYTDGPHSCKVYQARGCGGSHWNVDRVGWSEFLLEGRAVECPCRTRF